jgi:hypothetical protein
VDRRFPELIASFERNSTYHAELLGNLIQRLRAHGGTRIILLEAPLNPRALEHPLVRHWHDTHVRMLTRLSDEWGVPYVQLDTEAELAAADFYDATHIGSPKARSRFTQALVERIVPELGKLQ